MGITIGLIGIINFAKGQLVNTKEAKEIQTQITQLQSTGALTPQQIQIAANLARNCNREINYAMDEVNQKNWSKALNHIINAKGDLAKLKGLGMPIEKYQKNIDLVRNIIYSAVSMETTIV